MSKPELVAALDAAYTGLLVFGSHDRHCASKLDRECDCNFDRVKRRVAEVLESETKGYAAQDRKTADDDLTLATASAHSPGAPPPSAVAGRPSPDTAARND